MVVSSEMYNMSTADFLKEVATIADLSVNEQLTAQGRKTTGHVAGSLKHGEAYNIVFDYQTNMDHRKELELEQNYFDHGKIRYNKKGSTRLDVYDTITKDIYDYKFVINKEKGVSDKQKNKIIAQGPKGVTKEKIHAVNSKGKL